MLSIGNVDGFAATHNEALKGIKRSRFSLHMNTARRRRWLLVQLVTAPALGSDVDSPPEPAPRSQEEHNINAYYRQFEASRLTWSAR